MGAMRFWRKVGCVLLLLACAGSVQAQLKWEHLTMDLQAEPGQAEAVARFKFVNEGKEPVTIKTVSGSCSCTVAQTDKSVYAAGEAGEVVATYKIGDRVGKQSATLLVHVGKEKESTTTTSLQLTVMIPELFRATPRLVFWMEKEEPKSKSVRIEFPGTQPVHLTSAKSSSDRIQTKVETVRDGKEYLVHVTPVDTLQDVHATLQVQTDSAIAKQKEFNVTTRVIAKKVGVYQPGYRPVPHMLQWSVGGEANVQQVTLQATRPDAPKVLDVDSSVPDLKIDWKASEDGKGYVVIVQPANTSRPLRGVVRVWTQETGPPPSSTATSQPAAATTQPEWLSPRPVTILVNIHPADATRSRRLPVAPPSSTQPATTPTP